MRIACWIPKAGNVPSGTTVVTRAGLNVMLNVNCLSCQLSHLTWLCDCGGGCGGGGDDGGGGGGSGGGGGDDDDDDDNNNNKSVINKNNKESGRKS